MQTKLVLGNSCIERDGADMVFRANTINVGIKPAPFTHCNHFKTQFYTENKKKKRKYLAQSIIIVKLYPGKRYLNWNHVIDDVQPL